MIHRRSPRPWPRPSAPTESRPTHQSLRSFSQDASGQGLEIAAVVARPGSADALVGLVKAAGDVDAVLLPRGGGVSYSRGFAPDRPRAVIVDLRDLDRIVEIDEANRIVTVEAGCTWSTLLDALASVGLRTPYMGPLSGALATVGGTLSQDSLFFGAARDGFVGGSVTSIDVVLADGSVLTTGATAQGAAVPFGRGFGPDLTGLFIGDAGALGIKAQVSLRLEPVPAGLAFASLAADDFDAVARCLKHLDGFPGLSEAFAFDPETHRNLRRSGSRVFEAMRGVVAAGTGAGKLLRGAKAFLGDRAHSLHLVVEAATQIGAEAAAAEAAARCKGEGAVEIPGSIPRAIRAKPFRPVTALLGPDGENWLPVHGVFPLDAATAGKARIDAFLEARAGDLDRHGIRTSLLTTLSRNAVVLEPQFFWPDGLTPYLAAMVTPEQRERFANRPHHPEARAAVTALRADLAAEMRAEGALHFQLGRSYPYLDRLSPANRALVGSLKAALDPDGRMNPGVLGLATDR